MKHSWALWPSTATVTTWVPVSVASFTALSTAASSVSGVRAQKRCTTTSPWPTPTDSSITAVYEAPADG